MHDLGLDVELRGYFKYFFCSQGIVGWQLEFL
jgi:hypothetical protein